MPNVHVWYRDMQTIIIDQLVYGFCNTTIVIHYIIIEKDDNR